MANLKRDRALARDWRSWSDPKNDDLMMTRGEFKVMANVLQAQLLDILDERYHPWRRWWQRKAEAWKRRYWFRGLRWLWALCSAPASPAAVRGRPSSGSDAGTSNGSSPSAG